MRTWFYCIGLLFAIAIYVPTEPAYATTITLREDSLRSNVDGVAFTGIPFDVTPGLVGLCDLAGCGTTGIGVSDSITFFVHSGNRTFFLFCSDIEPPGRGDHGDICPPVTGLFDVALQEQGVEGRLEVTPYNPSFGQPGFGLDANGAPLQYLLISDIPEPGTNALIIFGLVCVAVARRRGTFAGRCRRRASG